MSNLKVDHALKAAIEQTLEGIQIIDRQWRYVYVNEAAARQGRRTSEELIGRTMSECYPGIEQSPFFHDLRFVMEQREPRHLENLFTYPDKEQCWFDLFLEPHPEGVLIRSIDSTRRKQLEEQFRHAQKMEAIGQLAGGIAHDYNNKLAIMLAYGEMVMDRLDPKDEESLRLMGKIMTAIDKSSALTRHLLAFGRKQILDIRPTSLNTLLEELRNGLEKIIGEDVRLVFQMGQGVDDVRVDPVQMEQVILNLCLNARDAMPEGGTLTLETANVELDQDYAIRHANVTPGHFVLLTISDTGHGMDRATAEKIFDPFFTTKPRGKGTGLGLSMVHGFVHQCNGHVWVYSEPGMGSVFKIYLPRNEETSAPRRTTPPLSQGRKGNETILLAEDDEALREAYTLLLEKAGYRVLSAADGVAAADLFRQHSEIIQMVLTDVVLPKMSGRDVVELVRRQKPGMKAVFMSGYTENSIVHRGVLDTESVLLQKPISNANLLNTVRSVLDGLLTKGVVG